MGMFDFLTGKKEEPKQEQTFGEQMGGLRSAAPKAVDAKTAERLATQNEVFRIEARADMDAKRFREAEQINIPGLQAMEKRPDRMREARVEHDHDVYNIQARQAEQSHGRQNIPIQESSRPPPSYPSDKLIEFQKSSGEGKPVPQEQREKAGQTRSTIEAASLSRQNEQAKERDHAIGR